MKSVLNSDNDEIGINFLIYIIFDIFFLLVSCFIDIILGKLCESLFLY